MSTHTAQEAGASMPPPRENLIRALPPAIEVVRVEGDAMPTLTGHFAVFDTPTEINSIFEGNFIERIAPGAFTKTIREGRDQMRVMFEHGQDPQIGNKVLGPIRVLEEDGIGARYEVPLLDTTYNRDLIPGLDAGLYGASFRFKVMQEEFVAKPKRSKANPDGLPERTVTEAQVREFGPVVWGAYATATAGLRSMTDDFLFARFVDDPDKLLELLAAYKKRRDEDLISLGGKPLAVTTTVRLDGKTVAKHVRVHDADNYTPGDHINFTPDLEPEPSAATTPPRTEPEPSAAATRTRAPRAGIYPYRKEKPSWLL